MKIVGQIVDKIKANNKKGEVPRTTLLRHIDAATVVCALYAVQSNPNHDAARNMLNELMKNSKFKLDRNGPTHQLNKIFKEMGGSGTLAFYSPGSKDDESQNPAKSRIMMTRVQHPELNDTYYAMKVFRKDGSIFVVNFYKDNIDGKNERGVLVLTE